jgi:hypothetical protein
MSQRRSRWRDRCFPWLTLVVAIFWAYTAWQRGPETLDANSTRLAASLFVGGMGLGPPMATGGDSGSQSPPAPGLWPSFSLLMSGSHPAAGASTTRRAASPFAGLQRASRTVEIVVYVWKGMMYGVAALLGAAVVVSWLTGRTRPAHLVVAGLMLVGSTATLAGMWIIESPVGGAMPPLPWDRYLLAGVALSAYAWVLIVAFARPVRPSENE